jgi:hypothetical protein
MRNIIFPLFNILKSSFLLATIVYFLEYKKVYSKNKERPSLVRRLKFSNCLLSFQE